MIEALRPDDLERCVELEKVLFPGDDPWPLHAFQDELAAGFPYLGAYTESGLVGYAGMALMGGPSWAEAEIHTLGVDPAWQGQGLGRALLLGLLAIADEHHAPVFLEVRTDNAPAIGLYEAHGFTRTGVRKRYYQPSGADAYTMAREARP